MTSARHAEAKKSLPVTRVVARFVYEGEIKGEWVDLDEAMRTWMKPADGLTVDRVEFIEKERPPRGLAAGMPKEGAAGLVRAPVAVHRGASPRNLNRIAMVG